MSTQTVQFREHYARLSDDKLIDIYMNGQLVDVARKCLLDELNSRGIDDLRERIKEVQVEQEQIAAYGLKIAKRNQQAYKIRQFIFYGIFLLLALVGLWKALFSSSSAEGWAMFSGGLVGIAFVWVRSLVAMLIVRLFSNN